MSFIFFKRNISPKFYEITQLIILVVKTQMCVLDWFKEFQLYQIAMMYMATRLFNNINQCYIPLFLQVTLKLHARFIATVPLAMFIRYVETFGLQL